VKFLETGGELDAGRAHRVIDGFQFGGRDADRLLGRDVLAGAGRRDDMVAVAIGQVAYADDVRAGFGDEPRIVVENAHLGTAGGEDGGAVAFYMVGISRHQVDAVDAAIRAGVAGRRHAETSDGGFQRGHGVRHWRSRELWAETGRHAFSAPSISPLKKSFWAKLKATMPGATTIM
jgi:hypothetical protein